MALNLFRQIVIYLAPVLPELAKQTGALLQQPIEHWDQSQTPLVGKPISKFKHLMQRIDPLHVQNMIEASKEQNVENQTDAIEPAEAKPAEPTLSDDQYQDSDAPLIKEPIADEITIDDFFKVDLRVARVVECEEVVDSKEATQTDLESGRQSSPDRFFWD